MTNFTIALGYMLLLGACDSAGDAGGGMLAGVSGASDELSTFVQAFAREALAAWLF